MPPRRVAVVLGPTASGKSDVAMAAARAVPGTEIIVVDAMQVYRGMDIGTAKPSAADQAEIPHHGLDLVDASTDFAVTDFRRAYDEAVATIHGSALVVAGTGLYLSAVIDRLDVPGQWPDVRRQLDGDNDLDGLWRRLEAIDPLAASRTDPGNRRRVVRALEVSIGGGRPFSSYGPGLQHYPPTDVALIGLRWPRPLLAERIERRVHMMMAAGLLDEVDRVARRGLSRTAGQALGYKELLAFRHDECSLDEAVAAIVNRTRRFATRQERWFRRDPRIRWIDIDHDPVADLAPIVIDALR